MHESANEQLGRQNPKRALVCGADGFIGHHLVRRLKQEGYWVRGVDLRVNTYAKTQADDFIVGDLRDPLVCRRVVDQGFDEVYQLAADMGGAGFIFVGVHDADIMSNDALINLNILNACREQAITRVFYSSSACIYPAYNQEDPDNPHTAEDSAYPAFPDSEYGWEKLFSERLYFSYHRCHGIEVRVARFHNIFGPEGSWMDGREKSIAALCRKVAMAPDGGEIEIWGDGLQTRSYLYIDECIEGVRRLMASDWIGPVNVGSEEMLTLNALALMIMEIANKSLRIRHVPGPVGVRGRSSNNQLIQQQLNWAPTRPLKEGLTKTYAWIAEQVEQRAKALA